VVAVVAHFLVEAEALDSTSTRLIVTSVQVQRLSSLVLREQDHQAPLVESVEARTFLVQVFLLLLLAVVEADLRRDKHQVSLEQVAAVVDEMQTALLAVLLLYPQSLAMRVGLVPLTPHILTVAAVAVPRR
jgi:hypothetical protein